MKHANDLDGVYLNALVGYHAIQQVMKIAKLMIRVLEA